MSENPKAVHRNSRVNVAQMKEAMESVENLQLVDIRQPGETEGGVVEGAILIPLTRLNERLNELDAAKPTIVYCAGGFRSSIAASRMIGAGFTDISDLLGGYGAWEAAHAPA